MIFNGLYRVQTLLLIVFITNWRIFDFSLKFLHIFVSIVNLFDVDFLKSSFVDN